ncbi:MAG: PEP-CTERM sorting domain-containing protein [Burkholderiales bacterium]
MKSITKNLVAAAALLAALGSAHAATNLVVDGSFEDQAQATGSWNVYGTLPGWTTVSGSGIELRNQVAGSAFDGKNFVELDSYNNSAMAQTLTTTAGTFYTLSFEYSAREGVAAASNAIGVYWNGGLLGTAMLDGIGQSGNVWHQYSFTVQGSGNGNDTLTFAAAGTNDALGGSLDAVSITAVPEPSTYAMMFGGLLLIGLSLSRRRAKR